MPELFTEKMQNNTLNDNTMLKKLFGALAFSIALFASCCQADKETISNDREFWVETMDKIARPVISNLAEGSLRQNMPFESLSDDPLRKEVSYLEAFGRTMCGIGPWLALGSDESPEGQLRADPGVFRYFVQRQRAGLCLCAGAPEAVLLTM